MNGPLCTRNETMTFKSLLPPPQSRLIPSVKLFHPFNLRSFLSRLYCEGTNEQWKFHLLFGSARCSNHIFYAFHIAVETPRKSQKPFTSLSHVNLLVDFALFKIWLAAYNQLKVLDKMWCKGEKCWKVPPITPNERWIPKQIRIMPLFPCTYTLLTCKMKRMYNE